MENSQSTGNATDTPNEQSQPQLPTYFQPQSQKSSQQQHNPKPKQNDNIDRLYTPQLKFTNFAAQAPIVTKYVTSKFLRHDVSYFQREEIKKEVVKEKENEDEMDEDEEDATTEEEEPEQEGSKVLVIHPGSKYLRIGQEDRQEDKQTDKQKDKQEDRLEDRQENKQEDKQRNRQEDMQEEM
ncbi:22561_t:CDS:2, partial [Racocetra persica]